MDDDQGTTARLDAERLPGRLPIGRAQTAIARFDLHRRRTNERGHLEVAHDLRLVVDIRDRPVERGSVGRTGSGTDPGAEPRNCGVRVAAATVELNGDIDARVGQGVEDLVGLALRPLLLGAIWRAAEP